MSPTKNRQQQIDIDEPDITPLPTEDKLIDTDTETEEENDELPSEDLSLDEEDLNPFGDKWEQ